LISIKVPLPSRYLILKGPDLLLGFEAKNDFTRSLCSLLNKLIFGDLKLILKFMKNLILLFSLLVIIPSAFSQSRPQKKIRKAFEQHAPQAKNVKWAGEGDRIKIWTADYTVGADSMQTKYDSKANWIYTLKFITIDQLPHKVSTSILERYQEAVLSKAAEMHEPDFDGYGVAFIYQKDRWAVAITKEGKVFRRQITSKGF